MPRTARPYSYIWTTASPPPWRAARWAVLVGAAAFALFLVVEGTTVELDPTLRHAFSLISQLFR
jgi:hypothetical protein